MRGGKGVDQDGMGGRKEMGGVEEGEAVRIYYGRKKSLFNKRNIHIYIIYKLYYKKQCKNTTYQN